MNWNRVLLLSATLLSPAPADAQWADAQLPDRGELQLGLAFRTTDVDRLFGFDGNLIPSSSLFSARLDPRLAPELTSLDAALDSLFNALGQPTADTSDLGIIRYDVLIERSRVPFTVTVGVTDWLAAFVEAPLVQGKSFVAPVFDSLAAGAGAAATAFGADPNATFAALGAGIAQLEAIAAADTLPPDKQVEAESLIATARTLESGLQGLRTQTYVPTDSSANGRRLIQSYEGVRSGFAAFSVNLPTLSLARPITAEEAVALSSGPGFGIDAPEGRDSGIKLGDLELGISLQPINTFRQRAGRKRPTFPLRARLDALWRFPTGTSPAANLIADPGTGDGQADLEFRATLDAGFGRRLWLSVYGSYTIQMETALERLITAPEAPIQPGAFIARVNWDPGDVLTLLLAPRFNLTRVITFSGLFKLTHHGRDAVGFAGPAPADGGPFDPSDLERGTEYTASSLGVTIRYSTTEWAGDRRPSLPVEVEMRYLTTLSARDGLVPKRNVWDIAARFYQRYLP